MKKFTVLMSLFCFTIMAGSVFATSEYGPEFDLYQSGYIEDFDAEHPGTWWFAPSGMTYKNIDEPIDYSICVGYKVNEWSLCKEILKSRGYRFHNTLNDIDVSKTYERDFGLAKLQ
tara:strand:- start:392 stop:739 length:348 start_codon:yes stop_codon:yes gene_type:complete